VEGGCWQATCERSLAVGYQLCRVTLVIMSHLSIINMKEVDLVEFMDYHFSCREIPLPQNRIQKGLPIMKLVIRMFALSVVVAGAAAATLSSSTTHAIASQSATAKLPIPLCAPGLPGCDPVTSAH